MTRSVISFDLTLQQSNSVLHSLNEMDHKSQHEADIIILKLFGYPPYMEQKAEFFCIFIL
jgi:hypothetical protein